MLAYCVECGKEYELKSNERLSDFQCECGGELASNNASTKQKGLTSHPVIRILVIFVVGVLFFTYVASYLFEFLLFGLKHGGPFWGTTMFAIFFGICIAIIIGLLWFVFKRTNES